MSIEYQTSGYIYPYRFGNQSPLPVGWPAPLPPASLAADPSTTLLYLTWTGPCDGVSIKGGSIIVTRQSDGEVFCLKLRHGRFPPADTGRLAFEAKGFDGAQQLYNIEVKIELDQSSDHVMDDKASSFVAALVTHRSQDVCIYFPRCGRRLWSDEASLIKISPYFDALESSECSENATESQPEEKEEEEPATLAPYEVDDSDEETDNLTRASESTDEGLKTPGLVYKTIKVTQHRYETYLALLCWLAIGRIAFAPLRSTFEAGSNNQNDGTRTRANVVADSLQLNETRSPAPVSPKSIYRLAHYLQIPDLPDIALSNFESQLSRANVMYELYSDVASKYPDLRDAALRYAVKYWKDVVKTQGFKEVLKRGEDEGLDGVTGLSLSMKLMEQWAK